jgi:type IV pilus assembly protein PilZ
MTARKTTKTKAGTRAKRTTKAKSGGKKKATKTTGKASGKEGREGHRVPIQLLVDYKSEGHYLFDFCRDLGTGGVFIETKSPLGTGSTIELTFTIPDSKETLNAKGRVIWVQKQVENRNDLTPGMGVQFEKFSDSQKKQLDKFVERYHGRSLTPVIKEEKEKHAS